jgi:Xaa-Pro aminopeptidase
VLVVGSPPDSADVQYATGFRALDPVVYLQHGRRRFLVVPTLELGRARAETSGTRILVPEALPVSPTRRRRLAGWVLGLVRLAGVRQVRVPPAFPLAAARLLERHGCRVHLARGPLFPSRAKKRPDEVARIAQSQRAAATAMRAALKVVAGAGIDRRGWLVSAGSRLTSERLRRVVDRVLLDRDCRGEGTIAAGGSQSADPHQQGSGPLRAGRPIVLDIFPRHQAHGYWGDLTRTVVKGEPSEELLRMYRAVRAAQAAALDTLRAGVSGSVVHRAAQDTFERRGFSSCLEENRTEGFIHGTGHGVGLEIHEAPRVGTAEVLLRAGNVVTIEPGLYYPTWGGVRIEDTVLVTRTGFRYLATCGKGFRV